MHLFVASDVKFNMPPPEKNQTKKTAKPNKQTLTKRKRKQVWNLVYRLKTEVW